MQRLVQGVHVASGHHAITGFQFGYFHRHRLALTQALALHQPSVGGRRYLVDRAVFGLHTDRIAGNGSHNAGNPLHPAKLTSPAFLAWVFTGRSPLAGWLSGCLCA